MFTTYSHSLSQAFYWACAAAVALTSVWALDRLLMGLRLNCLARRITTPQGFVRLSEKDIHSVRLSWPDRIANEAFPEHLNRYIRRLTEIDLARYSVEYITKAMTPARAEVCRAITIAAARYGLATPHKLFLLDSRTVALQRALNRELRLQYVANERTHLDDQKDFDIFKSPALTEIALARYTSHMTKMASVLTHFAMQGPYPSFENFAKTFQINAKRLNKDNVFEPNEIRAMVSAYAILTQTPLPKSYVLVNSITQAIVEKPQRCASSALRTILTVKK